jgi:hypothetical protein
MTRITKKRKWVIFTFHIRLVREETNTFKDNLILTAFKTILLCSYGDQANMETIYKKKLRLQNDLPCIWVEYIGQTGRQLSNPANMDIIFKYSTIFSLTQLSYFILTSITEATYFSVFKPSSSGLLLDE